MKKTSNEVIIRVKSALLRGLSQPKIAKIERVHQSTISRIRKSLNLNTPPAFPGRPKILSDADIQLCARNIRTGKIQSVVALQDDLSKWHGKAISRSAIANSLHAVGFKARTKQKKPMLSPKNVKSRLAFAKKYKNWTVDEWRKVIFSDETKINRFGSDGREFTWRKDGEQLRPHNIRQTLKHGGGSIMVWSCMSAKGPGYIQCIEGKMNAKDYQGILESDLLDTFEHYGYSLDEVIFQHDNDPKHTAKSTKKWLVDKNINALDWPANPLISIRSNTSGGFSNTN